MAKKGHWPRGKRRNQSISSDIPVASLVAELGRVIESRRSAGMTQGKMAERLEVNRRTLQRWLDGTDIPGAAAQGKLLYLLGHLCGGGPRGHEDATAWVQRQEARGRRARSSFRKPTRLLALLNANGACHVVVKTFADCWAVAWCRPVDPGQCCIHGRL